MDIRTIYQIAAIILGCMSVYIYLIQLSTPNLRGIGWASLGFACASSGTWLVALRGHIPDFLSILAGNSLLLFLNVGLYWGVSDLLHIENKRRRWLLPGSVLPVLCAQLYFTYGHDLVAPRIYAQSIVIAAQSILLVLLVLKNGPPRTHLPRWCLAGVFILWAAFQPLRMYETHLRIPGSVLPEDLPINPNLLLLPVLAAVFAGLSFVWLSMTQLCQEMELISETDSLTGLLNRRALERSATREIALARRRNTPLSLIILDLDRFKALNDSHGHAAGDIALASAARCISQGLRQIDLIARFGGEEFIALLPDTTQHEATHVAERIRSELESLTIRHLRKDIQLSASFGVTTLLPDDTCMEEIVQRGDIALYQAKHRGRNQVVAL